MKKIEIWVYGLFLMSGILLNFTGQLRATEDKNNPYGNQKALTKAYQKAMPFYQQGIEYFSKGLLSKSEGQMVRCLEIFPHHYRAQFYLARIYLKHRRLDRALKAIRGAESNLVWMFQRDEKTRKRYVNQLKELEKYYIERLEKKREVGAASEVKDPSQYAFCANNIESGLMKIRNRLKELRASHVSTPASYHYVHGNILFRMGDYPNGKIQYLKAIDRSPEHAMAHFNLSTIYFKGKNYLKALRYLERSESLGLKIGQKSKGMLLEKIRKHGEGDWCDFFPRGIYGVSVRIKGNIQGNWENQATTNALFENTYIVFDPQSGDAVIIDPGAEDERVDRFIKENKLKVKRILNTHGHFDHTGANRYYATQYRAKVIGPEADKAIYSGLNPENRPDIYVSDDMELKAGSLSIKRFSLPGHTAGSSCYYINGSLFCGDAMAKGTVGSVSATDPKEKRKTHLKMVADIKTKLLSLPANTLICPGHGAPTSVKLELENNPFFISQPKD